jgi:hypothetical protein
MNLSSTELRDGCELPERRTRNFESLFFDVGVAFVDRRRVMLGVKVVF